MATLPDTHWQRWATDDDIAEYQRLWAEREAANETIRTMSLKLHMIRSKCGIRRKHGPARRPHAEIVHPRNPQGC